MIISKGMSHGTLPDESAAVRAKVLDATARAVGPDGFIRAPLKWHTNELEPQWEKYDRFLAECTVRKLRWCIQLNTTIQGGGVYAIPDVSHWGPVIRQVVARYWTRGCKTYEVWNEPNTGTGNASGRMTPHIMAKLLGEARVAIRGTLDPFSDRGKLNLCAMGMGTASTEWLDLMYQADPKFLFGYTTLTLHLYPSEDPVLDAYRKGVYKPRRVKALSVIRAWLNDHGYRETDLGVTEGGYSGSNDGRRPPNVVTEALQAEWEIKALEWMKASNDVLQMRFWCHYNPVEKGGVTFQPDGNGYDHEYWQEHLAAFRVNSIEKPLGVAYRLWKGI